MLSHYGMHRVGVVLKSSSRRTRGSTRPRARSARLVAGEPPSRYADSRQHQLKASLDI